jgi:hypothetical protein
VSEASALVASEQWPGIYWTLNDSGNDPFIFAFDEQGRSRGTFRVEGADNLDWEAMQLGRGADGGFALYIGDIGDNDEVRRDSVIYRIPEPQPEAAPVNGQPRAKPTARAEAFKFTFPGGSKNTEAMLLHPKTGQIFLVTKNESAVSRVFRLPMPLDSKRTVNLESVGRIDLDKLGTRTDGLVTDAAISADGRRVAIRTYTTLFEFELADGESLDNLVNRPARFFRLGDGPQGEGITYRLDGNAVMTIGESSPAILFETPWQC